MFDTSLPVSSFIPVSSIPDPHNVNLWCKVNEETRQDGNMKDMIFKCIYFQNCEQHQNFLLQ